MIRAALVPPLIAAVALSSAGCAQPPDPDAPDDAPLVEPSGDPEPQALSTARRPYTAAGGKAQIYFTRPGTTRPDGIDPGEDPEVDDAVFDLFSNAQHSVDVCLFEFNRDTLIDGVLNALINEVPVRFVGDGDELHDPGYQALADLGVELVVRKPNDRIMHNKFAIVDDRWVVTGSMNFSENGVMRNNNNVVIIDSPEVAAVFQAEFDQMWSSATFGRSKAPIEGKGPVIVGGRQLETYFSPYDRVDEVLRGLLATADHSVLFYVFSFTHKAIRDDLIALHEAGIQVLGIFDESQARGRYSVDEDLARAGVPVYIDGNKNFVGFSGGKLHHKVLVVDGGTDSDPVTVTGSFNWSNNATHYNDENLVVMRGADLAEPYVEEFCRLLEVATPHPDLVAPPIDPCTLLLKQVRINELLPNPDGPDRDREFVEIVNAGGAPVDLSGWVVSDLLDDRHVFAEGTVLDPAGAIVVWAGPDPEGGGPRLTATSGRLSLNNNHEVVRLRDASGTTVDEVTYSSAPSGIAFNRAVDGTTVDDFERHDVLAPDGAGSSPGRQVDGARWPAEMDVRDVIINEILPDPVGTDRGQEYVEIVNIGPKPADLGGWTFSDALSVRHTFAEGTILAAGHAVVLYDEGEHPDVVGAITSSTGFLSLNNGAEELTLRHSDGSLVDTAAWTSTTEGISLNRAPDGTRDAPLVPHDTLEDAEGAPMSPGDTVLGLAWGVTPQPVLVINELLPDPVGTDLGQEYVEIVNVGLGPADMTGMTLGDAVKADRHIFAPGFVLDRDEVVVVYDRGDHSHVTGAITSSTGTLSLNNTGDAVYLYDSFGEIVDAVLYEDSDEGVSLNRSPDGERSQLLVPHDEVPGAVGTRSPGTRVDGSAWSD